MQIRLPMASSSLLSRLGNETPCSSLCSMSAQAMFEHVDCGLAQEAKIAARDCLFDRRRDASCIDPASVCNTRDLPQSHAWTDMRIEAAAQ
jgi:hypothetical protein